MNVLEEYLVKIGADIDKNAFSGASQAINQLAGMFGKLNALLKYGGLIAAIAKVTAAIKDNIVAVAQADMEYQKLAKSMWVTKETAKSLDVITKTMGVSAEDIAWIPELREQFFRLREEMNALATPSDADGQLRWIREIGYDVQSLQLKLKMLREWIVYYLIKYLQPHIKELQNFIRWLGSQLGKNMPQIARTLARVLSGIVSLGVSAMRLLKSVYGAISRFVNGLPEQTKKLVAAFALAGAAIMSGPFGMMMIAIGAALLLLEDFYYYLDGKKSSKSLAPLWRMLTQTDGPVQKTLSSIKTAIEDILNRLTDLFGKILTPQVLKNLKETAVVIVEAVMSIAKGIADIISKITGNDTRVNNFWDAFAKKIEDTILRVSSLARIIGRLFKAMGLAMSGEWGNAKDELLAAGYEAGSLLVENLKEMISFKGKGLPGGYDGGDKGSYIYKKLKEKGYSDNAAAGIVGNLQQESSLDSSSIGDKGTSGGLAQWHDSRWEALKKFAAKRGKEWTDLDTQIDFLDYELKTQYSGVYEALQKAGNAGESALIFSERYEIPDKKAAYNEQRMANAYAVQQKNNGLGFMSTSYAADFANNKQQTNHTTTYGGVVNVGDITINCGPGTNPQEVAKAVQGVFVDMRAKEVAFERMCCPV